MSVTHHDGTGHTPDGRPLEEQPKWRRDFPVDWPQDEYVGRRDFVKFMLLTSLAFVAGQLSLLLRGTLGGRDSAPRTRLVTAVDDVPVGGTKTFEYPEGGPPRLLLRLGATRFVAFDQRCTHLQCPVVPHLEDGRLHCPCHNGWFDAETGRALAGPPRRRLPRVKLEIRDGNVFATGVVEEDV